MVLYTMFSFSAILQHLPAYAQQTADKIEGIWKGTSLCQVKPSACHDENVVYHISKKSANLYTIQANKIVNGAEVDMGTFDPVVYDETKQTLTFTMKDHQGRSNVWLFNLKKCRFNQVKAGAFTNALRGLSHIFVCLGAATAVSNDQDTVLDPNLHAATPGSTVREVSAFRRHGRQPLPVPQAAV